MTQRIPTKRVSKRSTTSARVSRWPDLADEQKNQFGVPTRDLLILASEVRSSTRDRLNEQAGEGQLCRLPPTRGNADI